MLVEPATSPTSRNLWPGYAVLTAAIALLLQRYLPTVPYSLELALLGGNILTRVVERRNTFPLTLIRREKLTSNIESFFFEIAPRIHFQPGQFLEWTVPHAAPDSRGIRRWFTIASAPTEPVIQLTTRFSKKSSSFKASLRSLKIGDRIVAHGLEGDFTLPADKTKGLVFIAGGIGITPFRSMIKFLLDSGEARDITLIYATKRVEDLVFMNIFEQAKEAFGIKIVPVVAEPDTTWHGRAGRVDQALFTEEAPDIKTSEVYISGPEPMVESISGLIRDLGVPNHSIHQDFFPGYPANDAIKQKVEN
jgi:ferredoxin-NADP reductase